MNEFELIRRHFTRTAPQTVLGVGDDAAIIQPAPGCDLHVSVDMLVQGRHFFADVDPVSLGYKALAVNLSDMAAMGATPRWALLSLALPQVDEAWAAGFARGFFDLAARFGVDLVGGDTTCGPLTLSVTIMGEAPAGEALRRSGAEVGDDIWVSGRLGEAALALACRLGKVKNVPPEVLAECLQRLERPEPRVVLGLALRTVAHAALDVSDGLMGDLEHMLAASGVGGEVDLEALPTHPWLAAHRAQHVTLIAAGGDDYELCFTAPVSAREALAAIAEQCGVKLSRIGRITPDRGARLLDQNGCACPLDKKGYDHFA
ncbi:thiamine-phosphate kinase [Craterilacuibacter sp. RT1T]|uniref:thiamine-phosphate kinase n=1 Tax=Craterilacuibacter sp. RT1T TaxID=2942211 RepID=UPI0020BF1ADF|nr:thiamine-phosphate kinase [Craterilacuibacter sp. RT1T]MCL6262946.1 thiamine-phosphate kinase [Craterilacuibacter sp. RT1T]